MTDGMRVKPLVTIEHRVDNVASRLPHDAGESANRSADYAVLRPEDVTKELRPVGDAAADQSMRDLGDVLILDSPTDTDADVLDEPTQVTGCVAEARRDLADSAKDAHFGGPS
jgi:hypothetical protein